MMLSIVALMGARNVAATPQVFQGIGLGPIPDGTSTTCGSVPSVPLNVTFNVSGFTSSLSDVRVRLGFTPPGHTWASDLTVELIAPSGGPSIKIFERIGASSLISGGGSGIDLVGPYEFSDIGLKTLAAAAVGASGTLAAGTYRAAGWAFNANFNNSVIVLMANAFASLTPAQINGTWTLRFTDTCAVDTASVNLAELTLTGVFVPPPAYSVSTLVLDLGRVRTNTTSEERFVEIGAAATNTVAVGFASGSCTISGTDAAMFQASQGVINLAAGAVDRIGVRFRPTSNGEKTATLTCANAQPSGVQPPSFTVELRGTGGTPLPKPNCYDVDGDGQMNALVDGLFIARLQLGLSPAAAAQGITFSSPRSSLKLVGEFMRTECGLDF